jgi:hypothetical protein
VQAEGVTVGDKGKDCLPFENKIRPVIKGGTRVKEKKSLRAWRWADFDKEL